MAGERQILVVDDVPDVCDSIAQLLGTMRGRVHVRTTSDSNEAMKLLEDTKYDLVISDYRMPGPTGLTVLRRARAIHPQGHRVLMSAYEDIPATATEFLLASPDALVKKPFDPADLRLLVEEMILEMDGPLAVRRAEVYDVLAAAVRAGNDNAYG